MATRWEYLDFRIEIETTRGGEHKLLGTTAWITTGIGTTAKFTDNKSVLGYLNELGAKGWEVVNERSRAWETMNYTNMSQFNYLLKRPESQ